jgi:hypothetical protein
MKIIVKYDAFRYDTRLYYYAYIYEGIISEARVGSRIFEGEFIVKPTV